MIYRIKYSIGGSALSPPLIKKINKEISLLEYKYIIEFNQINTLILKNKESKKKFKIELPDGWPWDQYRPIINGEIFTDWETSKHFIDILLTLEEQDTNTKPRMLIYCHPRIVDFTKEDSNHWQRSTFEAMLIEQSINKEDIKVDTIDVLPGGSKQGDGFSESFIDFNENKFDIVVLPDCGGLWYDYQKDYTDENFEKLKLLMIKLLKIVKLGGIIRFGKILFPEWTPRLIDELIASGYNCDEYLDGVIKYITIKKE